MSFFHQCSGCINEGCRGPIGNFKFEYFQSVRSCVQYEYLWACFILEAVEVGGEGLDLSLMLYVGEELAKEGLGVLSCEIHVWDVGCRVPCLGFPDLVSLLGKILQYILKRIVLAIALGSVFTVIGFVACFMMSCRVM